MFRFIHSGVDQLVLGMRAIMGEMVELRPWPRYQSWYEMGRNFELRRGSCEKFYQMLPQQIIVRLDSQKTHDSAVWQIQMNSFKSDLANPQHNTIICSSSCLIRFVPPPSLWLISRMTVLWQAPGHWCYMRQVAFWGAERHRGDH